MLTALVFRSTIKTMTPVIVIYEYIFRTQLQHHMKYRPIIQTTPSKSVEDQLQSTSSNQVQTTPFKSGTGDQTPVSCVEKPSTSETNNLTQPELIQTIVTQVLQLLKPSADNKIGGSGDGLVEDLPNPLPPELSPNVTANQTLLGQGPALNESSDLANASGLEQSDSLNDTDQKLLQLVPPFRQPKAKKFLSALKEHGEVFRYTKDGAIYIDGELLSDANFFKLFPYLFKPANYSNHPHLQEVVNELATLGLGHMISRFYTAGLSPRGKNFISDRHAVRKQIKSLGANWYKLDHD